MKTATYSLSGDQLNLKLDIKNIGLQDWNMKDEGLKGQYKIGNHHYHHFNLPNIEARKSSHIEIPIDLISKKINRDELINKDGNVEVEI